MARLPRLSVGGWPHLLIQRGHNRQFVFLDAADRDYFRSRLAEAAKAYDIAVHAYALRDQELRLLVTPSTHVALGRLMQAIGRSYGAYFNKRHGRTGGLWEGRFRTTVIDPEQHLLSCMRFVEAADELTTDLHDETSLQSSAPHHLGMNVDTSVSDHSLFWSLGNTPFERQLAYRRLLEKPLSSAERLQIEAAVSQGWPLGSDAFRKSLAALTDRRLSPLRAGRPRKPAP
jgi:putative transposase